MVKVRRLFVYYYRDCRYCLFPDSSQSRVSRGKINFRDWSRNSGVPNGRLGGTDKDGALGQKSLSHPLGLGPLAEARNLMNFIIIIIIHDVSRN